MSCVPVLDQVVHPFDASREIWLLVVDILYVVFFLVVPLSAVMAISPWDLKRDDRVQAY
jgi:hypothetical protein